MCIIIIIIINIIIIIIIIIIVNMNMNIISWLVLLSLLLLLYYLFVCSSGALFVRPCRVGTVRVCGWFGYADKSRRRENMVGVNMVLAEIIQLLKVICYNPCFHVGGSLR